MKRKFLSSIAATVFAVVLIFSTVDAEAKFWGKEKKLDAYVGGDICETTSYYVFWIKVSEKTECGPCC